MRAGGREEAGRGRRIDALFAIRNGVHWRGRIAEQAPAASAQGVPPIKGLTHAAVPQFSRLSMYFWDHATEIRG